MSNEKQQTAVELFIEQLEEKGDLRETPSIKNIQLNIDTADYIELKIKAKEMEKEKRSIELPSDEEINAEFTLDSCDNDQGVMWGLRKGAIWMRDKIQGGNK
jgi:hypothetical protein